MQKLIAAYLFQNKKVVLPGIGSLESRTAESVSVAGEQKITAPQPSIIFTAHEGNADGLVEYISANKHISREEAAHVLKTFADDIQNLSGGGKIDIDTVGSFIKDADRQVIFVPQPLPDHFLPDVAAVRVIHPDRSHSILVGDKETDSNVMTEYFAEAEPAKKPRWWLWAAILLIIASSAIIFYLNNENGNKQFGIAHKDVVGHEEKMYRVP